MTTNTTTEIFHLINGKRIGAPEAERHNPSRPDDLVAVSPVGDAETVALAVQAAQKSQRSWAKVTLPQRGAILTRTAELLLARIATIAADLTREEGKTLTEARGEVLRAAEVFRFFGGEGLRMSGQTFPSSVADTFVYTKKEPLGVVGLITPWNFPIAIPAWKAAPALIAGNAVVIKPAGLTPTSVWHLAHALEDAGLPAGVFNVVYGPGSILGNALVENPAVAAISFTGSTSVGRGIHARASKRMARVQLEMGGKNALVVLDDADPTQAAQIAASGAFGLTGQACTATSRIVCTKGVHDQFVEALINEAMTYSPKDGFLDGARMGPVVSENQLSINQEYLAIAKSEGGRVVAGGGKGDGLFYHPAIITGVEAQHRIAQEEVFGPVVGVIVVDDLDEAIKVSNGVSYGLSSAIVTNDLRSAHRFADEAQAGVVKVNRPTSGLDLNVPFGGVKDSSSNTYREQGAAAVDFYSWSKSIYMGVGQ